MIGGLLQQNGKEHYERPHCDRDWSSPTGFKLTQRLPAEFKESKAYLDSRELYGKTFLRNIAATSWSSKYGLAGRPIADLRLTEILWKGFRNHHLRALSHGHFMALVVTRKIHEVVFASALLSGIRENKWDMEELARSFSRLIQNFVRKGNKVVLKNTTLYLANRRTLNFLGFLFGSLQEKLDCFSPGYCGGVRATPIITPSQIARTLDP